MATRSGIRLTRGWKCCCAYRDRPSEDSGGYAHSGGPYEWDSSPPVAVAAAAGLWVSRLGGELVGVERVRRRWDSKGGGIRAPPEALLDA
jgi:hypothetical protein